MRNRTHWFSFLIVALVSCIHSAAFGKASVNFELPQFRELVSPISTPIKLEYKPATVEFNSLTTTLEKGKKTLISTEGRYTVSEMGQLLLWNLEIVSVKTGNRKVSPELPIIKGRLLTEKNGKTKEIELTYPALEQQVGDVPKWGTKEFHSLVAGWSYSFFTVLPEKPIRTGDTLYSVPVRECIPENQRDWLAALTKFEPAEPARSKDLRWKTTLKGWADYEGKRVLVGEIDESTVLKRRDGIGNLTIKIKGYTLLDAETFQPLKGETLLSFPQKGDDVMVHGIFCAKIK